MKVTEDLAKLTMDLMESQVSEISIREEISREQALFVMAGMAMAQDESDPGTIKVIMLQAKGANKSEIIELLMKSEF